VKISGVHIRGFDEIWVQDIRFDGKIDLSGEFTLDLGKLLAIPHGRLEFLSGQVFRDGKSIAQRISGSIDAGIREYHLDREHGLDIFKTASANIFLGGRLDSLDPVSFMLRSQDWFRLLHTEGDFSAAFSVAEGRVDSVQEVKLKTDPFLASFSHFMIQGAAEVSFSMLPDKRGAFEFQLPSYEILAQKGEKPMIEGKGLKIGLESPDLDIEHFYQRVVANVKLPDAVIKDFGFLNHWIPESSDFGVLNGAGTVSADFSVSNDPQHTSRPGKVNVSTDRVHLKKGKDQIEGKVRVAAMVEQVYNQSHPESKELRISGSTVHIEGALAGGAKSWITDMKVETGSIRPDEDPELRAKLTFALPDVAPFLWEFGIQSGLGKVAQNLLASGSFSAVTNLKLGDQWIDLDGMNLISSSSDVMGFLHLRKKSKKALALIHYGILHIGVEINNQGHEFKLLGAENWYKEKLETFQKP
jgi:hypothetical protein